MKKIVLLLAILSLASCKKDPYPKKGMFTVDQPPVVVEVRPAISADIPDTIEYSEGEENSTKFKAVVPAPGMPVMSVEKLPPGAMFDKTTYTLSWTPLFTQGNSETDATVKVRIYPIMVWVRSSEDDIQAVRKQVNLVVYDKPQPITVTSDASIEIKETEAKSYEFTINNNDYPIGPFEVSITDFPSNVKPVKINHSTYRFDFLFDTQHVTYNDQTCSFAYCKKYTPKIVVTNPAGHRFEKTFSLNVIDQRVTPKIVLADTLEQGLDVNFQVGGVDLNSEVAPRISMLNGVPQYGKFEIKTEDSPLTYSSVARISWTEIPPSFAGTTQTFSFRVCTYSTYTSWNNCVNKDVKVSIIMKDRPAPKIQRDGWEIGQMKFLNFKERFDHVVKIVDAETPRQKVTVTIFPESIQKYVVWSNDKVSMLFDKAGIYQFNITATSAYGVKAIESFVVEVFPETRGKVLLLSDSSRDKEVQFYRKQFKSLEIVNPFLQELGSRLLAGRSTLIVGTSVLVDPESQAKVQEAADSIKDIIIATPMIKNLPPKIYKQLTDDFSISVVGRYQDIPRLPALHTMSFVTRKDFAIPQAPLTLGQAATTESSNPMVFSTGVDTENCDAVLEVADAIKDIRAELGIICNRPTGGRIALFGTEWADLKINHADDGDIPHKWLGTMMTGNLLIEDEQ